MSVRDVKIQYEKVCNQYLEMKKEVQDWEIEASKNMVDPERLKNLKEMIAPLMKNYERWSYIMFLLNQPVRKSKQAKYKKQNQKRLNSLNKDNSIESTLKENEDVINKVRIDKEDIKN